MHFYRIIVFQGRHPQIQIRAPPVKICRTPKSHHNAALGMTGDLGL